MAVLYAWVDKVTGSRFEVTDSQILCDGQPVAGDFGVFPGAAITRELLFLSAEVAYLADYLDRAATRLSEAGRTGRTDGGNGSIYKVRAARVRTRLGGVP